MLEELHDQEFAFLMTALFFSLNNWNKERHYCHVYTLIYSKCMHSGTKKASVIKNVVVAGKENK